MPSMPDRFIYERLTARALEERDIAQRVADRTGDSDRVRLINADADMLIAVRDKLWPEGAPKW